MTVIQALVLGAVQGLTEFLPVSSSGHLVIFQHILGIKEAPLTFDVLVHIGTLVAVCFGFWDDIISICKKPLSKLTYLLVVGSVPAGLIGFCLAPFFERAFESLLVVGIGLIFTGTVLRVSEYLANKNLGLKEAEETTYGNALFIGIFQALAIMPGISRSGSTIAAGLASGLERDFAARFSFLLSIPAIIGAGVFELKDFLVCGFPAYNIVPYSAGFLSAAVFGYFAIRVVIKLVREGRISVFSYYCWIVAVLTLAYYFLY